jgi:hypothetical protein
MRETRIYIAVRRAINITIIRALPPCKEIVKIVSASLDRNLTLRERTIMRLHLAACKPCVRYMEQSHFLRAATSGLDEKLRAEVFSGRLSDEARDRIKARLRTSQT